MTIDTIKQTELTQSERDVLKRDAERWRRMGEGSHLDEWLAYGEGLMIRRRLAMHIAFVNRPEGKNWWIFCVGLAKLQLGAVAEAVDWFRRSIEANRNLSIAHFHLAAALALFGSVDQARDAVQAGLRLDPNFTLRRFLAHKSSDNPSYLAGLERQYEGMRLAGVPEG